MLLLALAVAQFAALAGRRWMLRRRAEGLDDAETTRWLERLRSTAGDSGSMELAEPARAHRPWPVIITGP